MTSGRRAATIRSSSFPDQAVIVRECPSRKIDVAESKVTETIGAGRGARRQAFMRSRSGHLQITLRGPFGGQVHDETFEMPSQFHQQVVNTQIAAVGEIDRSPVRQDHHPGGLLAGAHHREASPFDTRVPVADAIAS